MAENLRKINFLKEKYLIVIAKSNQEEIGMKKLMIKSMFILLFPVLAMPQVADHLILAEVYGGGGEQGSYWKNDYILLYNPTENVIDLSTWSVQYAIFQSSRWQVINLMGIITAGEYYFLQFGGDGSGNLPLPFTPNVISTINLDKNKGKVALTNFQEALTSSNPIGQNGVVDFIGYGNGTNAFEGSGPASQTSTTESIRRKDNFGNNTYGLYGNGWDSNDNLLDFYLEDNLIVNPPLPVELAFFTAKVLKSGGIKLDWRTETEVNNYGFEVQKSVDGSQESEWKTIGFVEGHGNSNSPKDYSFTDIATDYGKYAYRLKQIDTDGQFEYSKIIEVDAGNIPSEIVLEQNYPNPFNPTTTIKFALAETQSAKLIIYNVLGNEVTIPFNGTAEGGKIYESVFDGNDLTSGIYFYRLETDSKVENRKMILIK